MKIKKEKLSSVDVEARAQLDFNTGDTVKVWSKILDEKGKSRLQAFEGIILARKHGKEIGATFTVRKVSLGVGVEKIFPLYSPNIDKIEITKRARARKAKLYYVRNKAVRDVRRKLRVNTNYIEIPEDKEGEIQIEKEAA